jgi:hypothetical protein
LLSLKSCCREEACGYAKVIHKKKEKKRRKKGIEKMEKCPKYIKQWVL